MMSASVATLSRKLCRPKPAPNPKCMVKPELSSSTTIGSCVITVSFSQKRRFAPSPSHHLTCCMRERFASSDTCLLGSLLCGASAEAAPISSALVLSTNMVSQPVWPGERTPVVSSCKQRCFARCFQLGEVLSCCRGPGLLPQSAPRTHWQTFWIYAWVSRNPRRLFGAAVENNSRSSLAGAQDSRPQNEKKKTW